MRKYIIYASDTGVIKSVITTSSNPEVDVPDGFDYIECYESAEGMAVDTETKTLVEADIDLPFVLTDAGIRKKRRNELLSQSDWTQFADSPLTSTKKSQWATYRQALRDLPQSHSKAESLDDIIWPIQPE
jgi:hypothetical protein